MTNYSPQKPLLIYAYFEIIVSFVKLTSKKRNSVLLASDIRHCRDQYLLCTLGCLPQKVLPMYIQFSPEEEGIYLMAVLPLPTFPATV